MCTWYQSTYKPTSKKSESQMAGKETSSTETRIIVQDVPFPTGITLDDSNYQLWSQLMEMCISARNKLGFLTGTTTLPKTGEKEIENWLMENNKVKSWLIDSMSPSLIPRFIRLKTAKEIWEAVARTFYDGSDETQLFELNRRSFNTKQNGRSLATYYNELLGIFQEIDSRLSVHEENVENIVSLHKIVGRLRVHIFLAGLDFEFNQARREILRKDPPLDLEACYAYVRKDQNQRMTMDDAKNEPDSIVHLASRNQNGKGKGSNKDNTSVCTHCGEASHSKQKCYEIIGYPEWWDFTKKPRRKPSQPATSNVKTEDSTPVVAHTESSSINGMYNNPNSQNNAWIIDTGATDHMTNDQTKLLFKNPAQQIVVKTANGGIAPVTCEGSAKLSDSLSLDKILVVPSLSSNLLSVIQIVDELNCYVSFWPKECYFQDIETNRMLGSGTRRGRLYYLKEEEEQAQAHAIVQDHEKKGLPWLWHHRLGHLSFGYLKKLKPELFLNKDIEFNCDICELAKNHRISYAPSTNKSSIPFMVIHSDVWGPAKISTPNGARYFVTFIDECTRMVWISLLNHKSEVCKVFQEFYKLVKTQYKCDIKVLQSDNGGEYINNEMQMFCKNNSIRHQTSCANTPEQNGVAERRNRQILEIVRASLFDMKVPRQFWGEAVRTAAYVMNQTPSRVIDFQTPLQYLQKLVEVPMGPNLEPKIFGCTAYVFQNIGKLEPRAIRCMFIRYAQFKKGYRCYDPTTRKIHVTRDVKFHETTPFNHDVSPQGEMLSNFEGNMREMTGELLDDESDEAHPESGSDEAHPKCGSDEAHHPQTPAAHPENQETQPVIQDIVQTNPLRQSTNRVRHKVRLLVLKLLCLMTTT